jgi:hypothetical protein
MIVSYTRLENALVKPTDWFLLGSPGGLEDFMGFEILPGIEKIDAFPYQVR